jgi:hypothetical protein
MDAISLLDEYNWETSLASCASLNIGIFLKFVGFEGSHRLIAEGYKMYISQFVHDVWTAKKGKDRLLIKAW